MYLCCEVRVRAGGGGARGDEDVVFVGCVGDVCVCGRGVSGQRVVYADAKSAGVRAVPARER